MKEREEGRLQDHLRKPNPFGVLKSFFLIEHEGDRQMKDLHSSALLGGAVTSYSNRVHTHT